MRGPGGGRAPGRWAAAASSGELKMEKSRSIIPLLAIAFAAGGFLVWFLVTILGARPKMVNVGPVEFEIPNEQTTTAADTMMTDTPVPTTGPPTRVPHAVRWIQEMSQVPENRTLIHKVTLTAP